MSLATSVAVGCGGSTDSGTVAVYSGPPIVGGARSSTDLSGGAGQSGGGAGAMTATGGVNPNSGTPLLGGAGTSIPVGGSAAAGRSSPGGALGMGAAGSFAVRGGNGNGVEGGAIGNSVEGGTNGTTALNYPSGGVLPPYGLPPFGGAPASGAGTAGTNATAGTRGCPQTRCGSPCPEGRWLELDGCTYCSCAPPKARLESSNTACPNDALSVTAVSSVYIGGINRLDVDLTWTCSAPATSMDQPLRATLKASLEQAAASAIGSASQIFYLPPSTATTPYLPPVATVYTPGSGVPEITRSLKVTESFLVVRREGQRLVGGIYLVGEDGTDNLLYTLAAPFDVAVPPELDR